MEEKNQNVDQNTQTNTRVDDSQVVNANNMQTPSIEATDNGINNDTSTFIAEKNEVAQPVVISATEQVQVPSSSPTASQPPLVNVYPQQQQEEQGQTLSTEAQMQQQSLFGQAGNNLSQPRQENAMVAQPEENHKESKNSKKESFFGKNKSIIAVALLCSLLGGVVGAGAVQMLSSGTTLTIPNATAPIEIVGGDVSPVVAIAEVVSPAVVGISNTGVVQDFFGRQYVAEQGSGSGIIFRQDGYIVTNYHVIENATSLTVTLADGRTAEATLVGADSATDLAVIKIQETGLPTAVLGDSDSIRVGELAVAIGNPLGLDLANTVTDGIISATNRQITVEGYEQQLGLIQTNAAINAGNSGGALVNSSGEVIGINSVKVASSSVEGLGFAIPINEAKPIIEDLMNKGYVSRPYMGIAGFSVTETIAKQYQLPVSHGVFIQQISENSPAAQSGLKAGDILYKCNDTILMSFEDLNTILQESSVGDVLNLLVDRNGQQIVIQLVLGEKGVSASS